MKLPVNFIIFVQILNVAHKLANLYATINCCPKSQCTSDNLKGIENKFIRTKINGLGIIKANKQQLKAKY